MAVSSTRRIAGASFASIAARSCVWVRVRVRVRVRDRVRDWVRDRLRVGA